MEEPEAAEPDELTLPDHPIAPPPETPAETSVETPAAKPAGPLGDLVAAHFRRVEVAMLGRVLTSTLAGALPASMVQVEWRRSLSDRMRGNPGQPIGVTVTSGDRMLTFRAVEVGVVTASVSHVVRGVVLSTEQVPVQDWLTMLGQVLSQLTADDEDTRQALERALLN